MDYNLLISSKRRKLTELSNRTLTEQFASDRSRVLYSTPFRRLSKKAQVFPLETNAAVRTRVTHSLEVSDVGRWIAFYVTEELIKREQITRALQLPIMYAVETACLLHDAGNPPFGHFGENAIKEWFKCNWKQCFEDSTGKEITGDAREKQSLNADFLEYDGNPQGLRIILRLQRDRDKYSLNLTYTNILALVKYVRSTLEESGGNELKKKPGYFETEREIVEEIKSELGIPAESRHPLTYIMEAADDIAYCISDIEDGIEKNILTEEDFFIELEEEWSKEGGSRDDFPVGDLKENYSNFFKFKTTYSRQSIEKAAASYLDYGDALLDGTVPSLFPDNTIEGKAIRCLKNVARRKLFRSPEAENPELAGQAIITGLLMALKPLLTCTKEDFENLRKGRDNPRAISGKNLDLHWRLFNKLPLKHIAAYEDQLEEFGVRADRPEWFLRAHLIVDFVSGMTDGYALELYQLLHGIKLL
jgi:dGTPase